MAITVKHLKVSAIPDAGDDTLVEPSDWNADHTLTGTVPIANGGTGESTATGAINALLPSQAGNAGKVLATDGTNTSWSAAGGSGTVTSVAATAGTGISVTGSPITTSGTLNITNTAPDQTVVLTAGTGISTTGTYPNFTITNTSPSAGGDVVGPASATDNAIARFDTTTGKLIQNSTVTITDNGDVANANSVDFDITPTTLPTAQGTLYWDNADSIQTLSLVMEGGNAVQQIGEETYFRIKCQSAITEGQVVMFAGTVGASGGLIGAPATGLTASTASYVMGVATESGATNDWIYVTSFGEVRNINTTGGAEAWVDGQILYYNPAVTGGLTKTLPSAPNPKVQVCAVVYAASNGSLFIRPTFGGVLGQYEGDVQVTTPANGDLLIRDQTAGKWVNAPLSAGTGISVTNTAGTITIANTAPSSGGTVTSVTGTAPVVSSGGNTPAISMPAATTSVDGYLTSTDWTTFNGKQALLVSGTNIKTINSNSILGSGDLAISASAAGSTTQVQYNNAGAFAGDADFTYNATANELKAGNINATNGLIVNADVVNTSYTIATGSNAFSVGPITTASGATVTVSAGQRWVVI
jgi:hypothetical protein